MHDKWMSKLVGGERGLHGRRSNLFNKFIDPGLLKLGRIERLPGWSVFGNGVGDNL